MAHHHMLKLVGIVFLCSSIRLEGSIHQNDGCNVKRCGSTEIRFPFYLKDRGELHKDEHCVFPPGFQLSCDGYDPLVEFEYLVNTSAPGVYLSFSVQALVGHIDYRSQQIKLIGVDDMFGNIIKTRYSYNYGSKTSFKPFTSKEPRIHFYRWLDEYTFFNCSSTGKSVEYIATPVASLAGHGFQVFAAYSQYETVDSPLTSCTKMYNISDVPSTLSRLTWSGPDCGHCEAIGQYCKFEQNSTILTQCYPKGPSSHKLEITGIVGGILFVLFTFAALYYATNSYKRKKIYELKIETFLKDYKALKPSRYSYADIKKISGQFKVKIGEGGFGSVFKGQLSNDVVVAVKVLNDKVGAKGSGEDFINEVSTIGLIHHVNVVRLVGYCADGCKRALVYEFQPNNSLDKFVFKDKHNKGFLGWEKMQDIALGIAKGIEYLHQGCAQPILHFDIKPHNILLDQNYNPKISDFGLAKLCTEGQSMVSMTMVRGTIGYIAPEVFSRNFGKVSFKSDVYSFGMLLLEMVGARDHTSEGIENNSEAYFPEWVFQQLEQGKETGSQNEEVVNNNIAKKLTIIGLWCINWHPADRPSMKHVIQLIQEEDCPAIPPNPFKSAGARNASMFNNMLKAISESD